METEWKPFYDGLRIKRRVNQNSLKLYDHLNVGRVELTINQPTFFKVYRSSQADPDGPKEPRKSSGGVDIFSDERGIPRPGQCRDREGGVLNVLREIELAVDIATAITKIRAKHGNAGRHEQEDRTGAGRRYGHALWPVRHGQDGQASRHAVRRRDLAIAPPATREMAAF